ncbi:MAG: hypothetical protein ACE15D_02335 [Candidatus Eisenbacteria bacterium]
MEAMIKLNKNAFRFLVLLSIGLGASLAGCSEESTAPVDTASQGIEGTQMGNPARLWVTVEDAENWYVGSSDDPWITDSWIAEANSFTIVVTNTTDYPITGVNLLVTMAAEYVWQPGWSVQVGDYLTVPDDFSETDTGLFGFDGGSHGVYPPSGTGIYYAHPMCAGEDCSPELGPHEQWRIPIYATAGGLEGFRLHFDAGSDDIWSPPSHDVTVTLPPEPPETMACCLQDGSCIVTTLEDCENQDGMPMGQDSCDNLTCGE